MRILITGASGFIGHNLIARLASDNNCNCQDEIFAVARQNCFEGMFGCKWIEADLNEANWQVNLPNEKIDCVVYLAQSKFHRNFPVHAQNIFSINVKAAFELAEWAVKNGVRRYIYASTGNVYGTRQGPVMEENHYKPETMYAATKVASEVLLKPFSPFMDIKILRLFGVYGPGQQNAMIPDIIKNFLNNAEIVLAKNIGVRINPIYIDDCVLFLEKLIKHEFGENGFEPINVCGNEIVDLRTLIDLLVKMTGKTGIVSIDSEKQPISLIGKLTHSMVSESLSVNFATGIKRTLLSVSTDAMRTV